LKTNQLCEAVQKPCSRKTQQDIGGKEFGGKQVEGRCKSSLSFFKMAEITFLKQHESPEMKSGKYF